MVKNTEQEYLQVFLILKQRNQKIACSLLKDSVDLSYPERCQHKGLKPLCDQTEKCHVKPGKKMSELCQ